MITMAVTRRCSDGPSVIIFSVSFCSSSVDPAWGRWAAVGARHFAAGASIAALGERESEHRALVLDVDRRVWSNVAQTIDLCWDGWSVLGETALPV